MANKVIERNDIDLFADEDEIIDKYKATELTQKLLWEDEIFIKDLTGKIGFEGKEYIRIAVRDYSDNEFLIEKLKEL